MVKIDGRSPSEAEAEARKKVLNMLPQDGTRVGWSQLEKKAKEMGMSLRTLRKHLDKCQETGVMARVVDTEARPPRVYYQLLTPEIFAGVVDWLPADLRDMKSWTTRISKIKDSKLLRQALDLFLELQTSLLMAELVSIWLRGIDSRENQQARTFYKIMIESYIAPTISELGLLCRTFGNATPDLLKALLDHYLDRAKEAQPKIIGVEAGAFKREIG
jgi:hypothetical protein